MLHFNQRIKLSFIYLIIALILFSFKYEDNKTDNPPSLLVFRKYRTLSESGIIKMSKLRDSLVDKNFPGEDVSSTLTREVYKSADVRNFPLDTTNIKIHLSIIRDSLWVFETENDFAPNRYILIDDLNRKLIYYDENKKNIVKSFKVKNNKDKDYEISIDKNDTKEIQGHSCFKMRIVYKTGNPKYGNTIFNCYVTDKIDLPFYSLVNIQKKIPNLFPLEVRIRPEKLANELELVYELIEYK